MNKIREITALTEKEVMMLQETWESSVRATHDFLSEKDIVGIKKILPEAFKGMEHLLCVQANDDKLVAFMGIVDKKIEMLFVDDAMRGQGLGKLLVKHAIKDYCVQFVDVNEQNIRGVGFYEHMGFEMIFRSPLDGQGNPFPLLHMQLKEL